MSNITQEQRETLALIDAIMAMFENKGEDENLNIGLSLNPFDFLFKIIEKYSSYEEVVDWLVTFLTASLPAIELSVKGIILANLKGMVDCNIDPRIPNFLRKELYTDNSEENGIFFNLSSIDYSGMLKISPLSPYGMNRYFGTRKYYSINDDNPKVKDKKFYKYQDAVQTCINLGINPQNIEDKSEITNVHELARAKDFNAFLWYVIHKAFYLNPKEINDVPLSTYSNSYTVKDDDGNDVQFTKKPFEDSDAKTFLEKVDGHVRLTLNYKTPPFVPGDVVTTAMGGNTYSLCISSVTSNQYAQKVQEPMYGDYGSDYVMLETTVVGYAPRDYDFTIVPMSDDLKSLNWYVNSGSFYDFLKEEKDRKPRDLGKEHAICNLQYLSKVTDKDGFIIHDQIRFTILPKPFVHVPRMAEPLWCFQYILFEAKGVPTEKGKNSVKIPLENQKSPSEIKGTTVDGETKTVAYQYSADGGFTLIVLAESGEYYLEYGGVRVDETDNDQIFKNLPLALYECFPGLTVYEFNYSYIMSQQLFEPTVVATQIFSALMQLRYSGAGNINFNLGVNKSEMAYQMRISEIVKNIVESTAYEVSDCFYTFSNDRYDQMLNDAELKRSKQYPFNKNGSTTDSADANDFYDILNSFDSNASLQENVDTFKRAFTQATATITNEVLPEDKYSVNFSIITEALKMLTNVLVENMLSPKLVMLFEVNRQLMGDKGELVSFEDILRILNGLIVGIVRELRDLILSELLAWVMVIVTDLLRTITDEVIKEQLEYYSRLIKLLLKACSFKASHRASLETELDHVDYADIDEIDRPLEANC